MTMKADIIRNNHDHKLEGGHLGVKKTYARIFEKYFWFDMYTGAREWIRLCKNCATKKRFPNEQLGIPNSHIKADRPFQTIGIDFMGPFPVIKQGNRHILVY